MGPLVTVNHIHRINMTVHQNSPAGTAAVDQAQDASIFINVHFIKTITSHGVFHEFSHLFFLAGHTGDTDCLLAQGY